MTVPGTPGWEAPEWLTVATEGLHPDGWPTLADRIAAVDPAMAELVRLHARAREAAGLPSHTALEWPLVASQLRFVSPGWVVTAEDACRWWESFLADDP